MENGTENKQHVHFGHVGLVALVAGLLLSIFVMKNGFHFTLQARADKPKITYDQVRSEVLTQTAPALVSPEDNTSAELAAIDPNYKDGSVLGTSTGTDMSIDQLGVPQAEQMVTQSML